MAYKTELQINFRGIVGVQDCTVEYTAIPASGDGWNEPREEARIEVDGVSIKIGDKLVDISSMIEDWDDLEEQVESELRYFDGYEPDYDMVDDYAG